MAVAVHVNPEVRECFKSQGLCDFDDFMTFDSGGGLNNGGRCDVQRFSADGLKFYIKSSLRVTFAVQLRLLLLGRANCGPLREKRLLDRLRAAGFATMEPVAWGEKRICGLPVSGFLVVKEIAGPNVGDLYDDADVVEKQHIMRQAGVLLGQLHAHGFFQPVRLKDMINSRDGFALIDRETSKPWPTRFSLTKCASLLARSFRRTQRGKHSIGVGSTSAFMRGYIESLAACRKGEPGILRRRLMKQLRRELGRRRFRMPQAAAPLTASS